MYLLVDGPDSMGKVCLSSCKAYETLEQIQEFLFSIEYRWNQFTICPIVYEIQSNQKILPLSDAEHETFVWPYSYNSRHRKEILEEIKK
jgi:hypothetical protein